MTGPAEAAVAAPARMPGQPLGARPRWRILYDAMAELAPGQLIRYEEMGDLLGLDFLDDRGRQIIAASARKAGQQLQRQQRKVFRIVRGHGYEHAQPGQVLELAHRHQARAVAEVGAGHDKIETIDLGQVDVTTARLIEATAIGFARQAAVLRQLDVRQERLETALAALTVTAQTAVTQAQETATRVDATQTEMDQLKNRLAQLENTQPRPAGSASFLRPHGT